MFNIRNINNRASLCPASTIRVYRKEQGYAYVLCAHGHSVRLPCIAKRSDLVAPDTERSDRREG